MKSAEIRQAFLDYFASKDHTIVASSPLVPGNDPTLLFTNAGMVQFKDVFLGAEKRPYSRAASSQRCVRAGGKHNDLENVGYTARHHTFFEMLGNFSFGDYFKRDAIAYAWEFLTQVMKLPPEKLWVTVFEEDDEAADIWLKEIGVDPQRFTLIGAKDNFWSMGDTGPCGPCTEIFYDHGPDVAGGPPGTPEEDGDRYVEIWNLVFMQYDRDNKGVLTPLPRPCVDTGMGMERLAAVMQGVHSNYDIDLFQNLIKAVANLASTDDRSHNSLKVIADHIRSCAFLICDGVVPSNEGRGYVLRRIMRRAIRHGHNLGMRDHFFHKLVAPLVAEMGAAYPELMRGQQDIERVILAEEARFAETLDQGMKILEQDISALPGKEIPGETVFRLYDTYGFPTDLTQDIARERGLTLDMAGFEREMEAQRERARAAGQFSIDYGDVIEVGSETEFEGYEQQQGDAQVLALKADQDQVDALSEGQQGVLVLDKTPFYAESGGQVGDQGIVRSGDSVFVVEDTQKQNNGVFLHRGHVQSGRFKTGDQVETVIDHNGRQRIALNHSATHLLHAALRQILGEHVNQKGSLVDPDRLRFDFSHFEPIKPEQLRHIERLVNERIRANDVVETKVMAVDEAMAEGAMALFGEKYGDQVRVLKMGEFSIELCGGTHVERCGDIGLFKIVIETGIAAGVRRIEAVTGDAALAWTEESEDRLLRAAAVVKSSRDDVDVKVKQLFERQRQLEKELEQLKAKMASSQGSSLADQAQEVNGVRVLAAKLEGADVKTLRDTVDQLKNKLGSAVVVLAVAKEGKVNITAGVTKDTTSKVKAGELVNMVAQQVGGKGGGRPDMAQAGGTQAEHLDTALASVLPWVSERLS